MSWKLANGVVEKQFGDGTSRNPPFAIKFLAAILALHCFRDSMTCHPKVKRLAKICETTERHVYRLLDKLEDIGFLTSKGGGGRGKHTIYTVHPEALPGIFFDQNPDMGVTLFDQNPDRPVTETLTARSINPDRPVSRYKEEKVYEQEKAREKQAAELFPSADLLPDWLPREEWEAFIEMRKKMRAPMTDYAKDLMIRHLDEFRKEGHDVKAILQESIRNSWKGVFLPKKPNGGIYVSKAEQRRDANRRAAEGAIASLASEAVDDSRGSVGRDSDSGKAAHLRKRLVQ